MADSLTELREHLAEIEDLRYASGLLGWDQLTMMPPRGAGARAESLATLERITHERFIDEQTDRLLSAAERDLDGCRARFRRRIASALHAPPLREGAAGAERAGRGAGARGVGRPGGLGRRPGALGLQLAFAPYLTRNVELARRYVDCFDGFDCAYDVLLDDYEPGARSAQVATLFAELKEGLVPLIATLRDHAGDVDDSILHGSFDVEHQRALVRGVLTLMGFTPDSWRLDDTVHPFAAGIGEGDVRITARWDSGYFPSGLYGAMHECGHGLYEEGIAAELRRTPLAHAESLGLHESQSRLWENMVGRGLPFCGVLASRIAELFGSSLADLDGRTLYRAVNKVGPSLIRVEADEATYGLHVVLRFELEQELIEGRLAVADLPEAWNARFRDYLGLDVPDDAAGVLQDVHWAAGMIGYFPTYALGNLIAGQLWAKVHDDLSGLDEQLAAGELSALREWLA